MTSDDVPEVKHRALGIERFDPPDIDNEHPGDARAPVVIAMDREGCTRYITNVKPALPQITVLGVIDREGNSVCRSDGALPESSFADRPDFKDAVAAKGRPVLGEHTVSRISNTPSLPFAMAIMGGDEVIGVVGSSIDLNSLGASLQARRLIRMRHLRLRTVTERSVPESRSWNVRWHEDP